ncbi:MAG: hypothetical protein K1X64_07105 [Myxococcaceae bacterium]|nr:hypothetical protein [Myxococcaceae bacterium]
MRAEKAGANQGPQKIEDGSNDYLTPVVLALSLILGSVFFVQNDETSGRLKLVIALAAGGLVAWGYWLKTKGRENEDRVLRDRLFLLLGLAGAAGYFNFGHLHFNNFIHAWDTYHYYVGSKYFPELGYERLYECAVVADSEEGNSVLLDKLKTRAITDLRTNVMVKVDDILAHPERCKEHFTAARWQAFKDDVRFFRWRLTGWRDGKLVEQERWVQVHHDHGYNATPVWTVAGYWLSNLGTATTEFITALNLIDPLYLLAMAAMLAWAFGFRVAALGLLVLGTNWPNRYTFTGGAFLRHDWLFFFVASVCLLKKQKPFLGGMAIAYAALLRLFPGLLLAGPLLAGLELLRRRLFVKLPDDAPEKQPLKAALRDPKNPIGMWSRYVAGGLTASVLLVGIATPLTGGLETWQHFAANTAKHAGTPLTNHMGWRTVVSWRPSDIGAKLRNNDELDGWAKWKAARVRNYHQGMPLFVVGILAALGLLYYGVRQHGLEPWVAAAAGAGVIAFGVELTDYYYCFLIALACLAFARREAAIVLMALAAVTQFIMWRPVPGMSGWLDEQCTAMSVASLLAIGAIWWALGEKHSRYAAAPEGPLQLKGEYEKTRGTSGKETGKRRRATQHANKP